MDCYFTPFALQLVGLVHCFPRVWSHGVPFTNILDAARFILAEHGLLSAIHSGSCRAYFVGVWFSRIAEFDIGGYIIAHARDTAHVVLQETAW